MVNVGQWDDAAPFITGDSLTATVLDNDSTPNLIIDVALGGSIQVDWAFSGFGIPFLGGATFTVATYADSVEAPTVVELGPFAVPGTLPAGSPPAPANYSQVIPIPANPTNAPTPGLLQVGAWRLTTLITVTFGAFSVPIAGFVDGPIIQVRPAP
jgi:hypothetical protein